MSIQRYAINDQYIEEDGPNAAGSWVTYADHLAQLAAVSAERDVAVAHHENATAVCVAAAKFRDTLMAYRAGPAEPMAAHATAHTEMLARLAEWEARKDVFTPRQPLLARIAELESVVKACEWGNLHACPICLNSDSLKIHANDCKLAAALKGPTS